MRDNKRSHSKKLTREDLTALKNQTVLRIGKPNKNNRIYTQSAAEGLVKDFNLGTGRLGVLSDHLKTAMNGKDRLTRGLYVNLEHASHFVTRLRIKRKKLIADIRIASLPNGAVLKKQVERTPDGRFAVAALIPSGELSYKGKNSLVKKAKLVAIYFTDSPA